MRKTREASEMFKKDESSASGSRLSTAPYKANDATVIKANTPSSTLLNEKYCTTKRNKQPPIMSAVPMIPLSRYRLLVGTRFI
jgi:hypothetical protein